MRIRGYLSFLNLTHHHINHFEANITELRCEVRDIIGESVKISTFHGYLYYRLYESEPAVKTIITQPYRAYCIAAPYVFAQKYSPGCDAFKDRDKKITFDEHGIC